MLKQQLKTLLKQAQLRNSDIVDLKYYKDINELYFKAKAVVKFVNLKIKGLKGTDFDNELVGNGYENFVRYCSERAGAWIMCQPVLVLYFKNGTFSLANEEDFKK